MDIIQVIFEQFRSRARYLNNTRQLHACKTMLNPPRPWQEPTCKCLSYGQWRSLSAVQHGAAVTLAWALAVHVTVAGGAL